MSGEEKKEGVTVKATPGIYIKIDGNYAQLKKDLRKAREISLRRSK